MMKALKIIAWVVGVPLGVLITAVLVMAIITAERTGQLSHFLKGFALIGIAVTVVSTWTVSLVRRHQRRTAGTPTGLHTWGD